MFSLKQISLSEFKTENSEILKVFKFIKLIPVDNYVVLECSHGHRHMYSYKLIKVYSAKKAIINCRTCHQKYATFNTLRIAAEDVFKTPFKSIALQAHSSFTLLSQNQKILLLFYKQPHVNECEVSWYKNVVWIKLYGNRPRLETIFYKLRYIKKSLVDSGDIQKIKYRSYKTLLSTYVAPKKYNKKDIIKLNMRVNLNLLKYDDLIDVYHNVAHNFRIYEA